MTLERTNTLERWISDIDVAHRLRQGGWNVESVKIGALRQKSALDAVLSLEVRPTVGADFIPVMLRIGPSVELDSIERKWSTLHPVPSALGSGVIRVEGAVALSWPNDVGLRSLRHVADVDRFKRLLAELPSITEGKYRVRGSKSTLEVLRWKPERRVVARAKLACIQDATGERIEKVVYVKVWPDNRGQALDQLLAQLKPHGLPIPRPLGHLLDGTVSVESSVAGENFFTRFHNQPTVASAGSLGRLLAQLHSLPAPEHAASAFDLLEGSSELVRALAPTLVTRFQTLKDALKAPAPGRRWVHGDLHLRQFMIDGDQIGLVDFERAGSGTPEEDMGLLLANLDDLALRSPGIASTVKEFATQLVDAWSDGLGGHDAECVRGARARGLLGLTMLPLRRHEPNALGLAEARLAAAECLSPIRKAPPTSPRAWSALYPKPKPPWAARLDDGTSALFDPRSKSLIEVRLVDDPIMVSHEDVLTWGRPIAHRAHSRVVFESHSLPTTFIKIVSPKRGRDLAQRISETERLRTEFGIEFPRLLTSDFKRGRFEFAKLEGTPWHDELMRDDFVSHADVVASALAALHEVRAAASLPTAIRPSTDDIMGYIADGSPDSLDIFQCAARQLPPAPGREGSATLHGDLHDRNVLIFKSTARFLDPDSLRAGPREEDEANLSAHLALRALSLGKPVSKALELARQFESRLVNATQSSRRELLDAHRSHTLFRLAAIHLFRKPWSYLVPDLLEAAVVANS